MLLVLLAFVVLSIFVGMFMFLFWALDQDRPVFGESWWAVAGAVFVIGGLILLVYVVMRRRNAEIKAKIEVLIALGFDVVSHDNCAKLVSVIESMFKVGSSVDVLASIGLQNNQRCYVAEVRESFRDGEDGYYVNSTVCVFDQTTHPVLSFRVTPHNNIAKTLCLRLLSWKRKSNHFGTWYDLKKIDDRPHAESVTPELREWLGKRSVLSTTRAWTVVSNRGCLMAYRRGTECRAKQYPELLTSIQELGEVLQLSEGVAVGNGFESVPEAGRGPSEQARPAGTPSAGRQIISRGQNNRTGNGCRPEDSRKEGPSREEISLSEWTVPTEAQVQRLQRLISQSTPRTLDAYWIRLTRPRVGLVLLSGLIGALFPIFMLPAFELQLRRWGGIQMPKVLEWPIAIAVFSFVVGASIKWFCWSQIRTRSLLRVGVLTQGIIDRKRPALSGYHIGGLKQVVVHVTFADSGLPLTSKLKLHVREEHSGAFNRFAKEGRQVLVVVSPDSHENFVLPEWLAVSGREKRWGWQSGQA
ncbi:MAG: hypothetical protein OSA98_14790 [Rubripirellula sp.]|nr:hypothetical protein [Rubripirellula sp.]